jgi:hypothetical protein
MGMPRGFNKGRAVGQDARAFASADLSLPDQRH